MEGGLKLDLRAFVPEPKIYVESGTDHRLDVTISNISKQAALTVSDESRVRSVAGTGVVRNLQFQTGKGTASIAWKVPFQKSFKYSVIGDSGGGSEFAWGIKRSVELGVDFMLHAGDLFYSDADFQTLPYHLSRAEIPIYTAIGNHDFHRRGEDIHLDFTQHVGPRNWWFKLGDTVITSFDTAASTWPVGRADRAALFDRLRAERAHADDWILLTHRPLHDPRALFDPSKSHTVSDFEISWLLENLKSLTDNPVLLAGHIHMPLEHEEDGIKTYISGDGLGTRDILSKRRFAKILIGEKHPGDVVQYSWQDFNIPYDQICHAKNRQVLELHKNTAPEEAFGPHCDGATT